MTESRSRTKDGELTLSNLSDLELIPSFRMSLCRLSAFFGTALLLIFTITSFAHRDSIKQVWIAEYDRSKNINTGSERGGCWKTHLKQELADRNIGVTAMIFYGRKPSVSILNSYLEKNLKRNGGLIDKVVMKVKTEDAQDLDYLQTIMDRNPEYVRHDITDLRWTFSEQYKTLDPNTLYLKIGESAS